MKRRKARSWHNALVDLRSANADLRKENEKLRAENAALKKKVSDLEQEKAIRADVLAASSSAAFRGTPKRREEDGVVAASR